MKPFVEIFDTTLRDGSQTYGVTFSIEDKIRIAMKLDELGVQYIEGGWPGANPKDTEFFRTAKKLALDTSKVTAFGSTHHPAKTASTDALFGKLIEAETSVVTIFGKSWDLHVTETLNIPLERNLEVIRDSVAYLKERVDEVIYDAEHFFDGYKRNPEYCLQTLIAAQEGGADALVFCDTNGGTLPDEVRDIIRAIKPELTARIGIHTHNDGEVAVANTLAAVEEGAYHVQGTINGIGERCGNANLVSVLPNLVLKQGYRSVPEENLAMLRELSVFVAEMSNHALFGRQPFVGSHAFAHKGGIHASAVMKNRETYEHIKPEAVGNSQKVLISDQAGKGNVLKKARDFGVELDPNSPRLKDIVHNLKTLEGQGYEYGGAEASFELVMRKSLGQHMKHFDLIGYKIESEQNSSGNVESEASVRMMVGGKEQHTISAGNGPVNALDRAMRKALYETYPTLHDVELLDYKVRVLATGHGTSAKVRVLIESTDGTRKWNTVGVDENIIEASWQALSDSIEYKLFLEERDRMGEVSVGAMAGSTAR